MSTSTRLRTACFAATTVLALSGCSVLGIGDSGAKIEDVRLKVSGRSDAWLHPDYANGIGRVYEPSSDYGDSNVEICGIHEGIVASKLRGETSAYDVILTNLDDGVEIARFPSTDCSSYDGAFGGAVYGVTTVTASGQWQLQRIDLATKTITPIGEPQRAQGVAMIRTVGADAEGGVYATVTGYGQTLLHASGIDIAWMTNLHGNDACVLVNLEVIGCHNTTTATMYSSATGTQQGLAAFPAGSAYPLWASDGVTFAGLSTDRPPAFDLNGKPIEDLNGWPGTVAPGLNSQVFIRLQDIAAIRTGGWILAVSQKGVPLIWAKDGTVYNRNGDVIKGAGWFDRIDSVTPTGDVFLVREFTGGELLGSSGRVITRCVEEPRVINGYVVTRAEYGTPEQIHVPAAP